MIDRYTTGVDTVLDEYTSQISLWKMCSIHFSAEDIKISINSYVSDLTTEPVREAGASAPTDRLNSATGRFYRIVTLNSALLQRPFYLEQIDQSVDKKFT